MLTTVSADRVIPASPLAHFVSVRNLFNGNSPIWLWGPIKANALGSPFTATIVRNMAWPSLLVYALGAVRILTNTVDIVKVICVS